MNILEKNKQKVPPKKKKKENLSGTKWKFKFKNIVTQTNLSA